MQNQENAFAEGLEAFLQRSKNRLLMQQQKQLA
jgi:hypothetical protein